MKNLRKNSSAMTAARAAGQKGYTIVELSISVAIAGVLLVSAIGLVQQVLTTNRANETSTLLIKAMAQIDKIWADQPDFNNLTLATAGAAGVFAGMQVGYDATTGAVNSVTSKFNRQIYVGLANDIPTTGAKRGYVITFAGIPTSVCADLVTAVGGGGVRGILVSPETTAGGTGAAVVPTAMSSAGAFTLPVTTPATVAAMDAQSPLVNVATAMGPGACGTKNATVALTFVNWK
jgi:prepilin-type N-terminal cleavage/methylation domain-containing protein